MDSYKGFARKWMRRTLNKVVLQTAVTSALEGHLGNPCLVAEAVHQVCTMRVLTWTCTRGAMQDRLRCTMQIAALP